jgi:putative phage-type endonuclease
MMGLTPEQHAIRLNGLGASEVPAIVGADGAWDSPLNIWAIKTGLIPPQSDEDIEEHVELGTLLEPVIAALYTRRTGNQLIESGTLVHPNDPLQIATPDRLVIGKPWIVQIKKVRSRSNAWGREGTDEIPESVLAQCQWELSVTGREIAEVPVLFFGSHLAIYRVKRDDEMISGLVRIAHAWWDAHVVARVPPSVDGSERTKEALAKVFPANRGKLIELGAPTLGSAASTVFAFAQDYVLARDAAKEAEERKEAAGNQLRLFIGDHDGFVAPWGKITWMAGNGGRTAWKALIDELKVPGELIAKHTSKPERRLAVTIKERK